MNELSEENLTEYGIIKPPENNTTFLDTVQVTGSIIDESFNESTNFSQIYRHSSTISITICIAYLAVFFVGLVGNLFVISVVFRVPRMRTVTNLFIANLALADVLVIVFCVPATLISNLFVPWILGEILCKFVPYIQGVSVAASVYSLIAVSLDRLLAIWWPLKMQISKKRAKIIIFCIWLLATTITIPWAIFFQLEPLFPENPDSIKLCLERWPDDKSETFYFLFANLLSCYLIPMIIISICYVLIWIKVSRRDIPGETKDAQKDRIQQQSKIKVVKMLALVVILFVLSWFPLYLIFAIMKFGGALDTETEEFLNYFTPLAQWLGSANSCINPVLYAFNEKYRRGFIAIIQSRSCWGRLRYYETFAITSSTASTRKSSHYQNYNSTVRKAPYSPSMKSEVVSYIYDQSSGGKNTNHHLSKRCNSTLSAQSLMKQDSNSSRCSLLTKQESLQFAKKNFSSSTDSEFFQRQNSEGSNQVLLKQDSYRSILSKQNSMVSYCDSMKSFSSSIESCNDLRKESILRQNYNNMQRDRDTKRRVLSGQDSEISVIDGGCPRGILTNAYNQDDRTISATVLRRQRLVKQNSVISFGEPVKLDKKGKELIKQDSVVSVSFTDQHEII